jgi:hypothetical protein
MTGRTGYTEETATEAFDPVGTPNRIFSWFDALVGESVATASALPASGNWNGRTIFVVDVKAVYVWATSWSRVVSVPTAWTGVSFATGFQNLGTPWELTRYRKDEFDDVVLVGQISIPLTNLQGERMFTLPVGFRPAAKLAFAVVNNTNASPQIANVEINTNGDVNLFPAGVGQVNLGRIKFAHA